MVSLSGTATIVTGGTSGIGYATACGILELGGDVVINARSPAETVSALQAAADRCGRRCFFVQGDISDPEVSARLADQAFGAFGRIDGVVHVAGGPAPGTIMNITLEEWIAAFSMHVHSTFHLFRARTRD